MLSTTAVCPRCLAEVSPEMASCGACNQVLKRPASVVMSHAPSQVPTQTVGATGPIDATQSDATSAKLESDTATGTIDRGTHALAVTTGADRRVADQSDLVTAN